MKNPHTPPSELVPEAPNPQERIEHAGPRRLKIRPSARTRRIRRIISVCLLCLLIIPVGSYAQALTYPGNATFVDRSVGWLRDNGANGLVNAVENWYYTIHAPSAGAPSRDTVPTANGVPIRVNSVLPVLKTNETPGNALVNEGRWVPGRVDSTGKPAIYTSFIRPDGNHQSVIAGIALIRQSASIAHLVAGTREPDTGFWPGDAAVPASDVGQLLATFNAGFKAKDIAGGFYLDGQYSRPLLPGEASAVITSDGRVSVGVWGSGVQMTPQVVAVRQNLHLIVANGQLEAGLDTNAGGNWGSSRNQLQYTWRSGLATDANGDLIYVAGDGLTLQTLAQALLQAGAVQGMELDIHSGQVNFSSWTPRGKAAVPTELLPGMPKPPDRYLAPDQRDFFYLTVK